MNNTHTPIKNFQDANEYLKGKDSRPYAHNTRIVRDESVIHATYHDNIIVTFHPNKAVYTSSGWKTFTTKRRLNWFLPKGFTIYQKKGIWYLHLLPWESGNTWIFKDGLTIDHQNIVSNAGDFQEAERIKRDTKRINKYVKGFVKALTQGNVPPPDSGDCWHCSMITTKGESLGDAFNNVSHFESHFEESYYVPSLLMNAINENRERLCSIAESAMYLLWISKDESEKEKLDSWTLEILARDVTSILTKYLKKRFNIAR